MIAEAILRQRRQCQPTPILAPTIARGARCDDVVFGVLEDCPDGSADSEVKKPKMHLE